MNYISEHLEPVQATDSAGGDSDADVAGIILRAGVLL